MGALSGGEELLAALCLAVQVASTGVVGIAGGRWAGRGDALLAAVSGWGAALCFAVAVPLALGMLTVLDRASVLAVHLAAVVVVAAVVRRRRGSGGGAATGRVGWRHPATWAVGVVAAYVGLAALVSLGPPSRDSDTREYHITNLATWLREGSIWELPYQSPGGVTATHPGDAEMLALWLSVPTNGDELAYLMPLAFGVLLVLGSALLARELAAAGGAVFDVGTAAVGAVAAVAVLTAPIYLTTQTASLSTDVAVAACAATGLGLLVASRRTGDWRAVAAAGAVLGLGLGSKYTALVPTAAIVVAALWVLPRRRQWWWLVPGVAALALPWYVRNLVHTGNPLFPQALGPLEGGQSPFQVMDDPIGAHLVRRDSSIVGDWVEAMARHVGPIVVVAAVGAALALVAAVARRRGAARATWLAVALAVAASLAGYLAVPFSGGGPTGLAFLVVSSLRYSMTAVALGAVCWAARAPRRLALAALAAVGAWNTWKFRGAFVRDRPDVGFGDRQLAAAVLLGLAAAIAVALAPRAIELARARRRLLVPAAILVAVVVTLGTAAVLHRYDRGDARTALEQAVLDAGGDDEPVAVLGVLDLRSLLGPRLQRPLVGVSRGGKVGEIPFANESQILRVFVEDPDAAPAPASFVPRLDDALARSEARLLVVGPLGGGAYPEGWQPDERWCSVAGIGSITLYERCGTQR